MDRGQMRLTDSPGNDQGASGSESGGSGNGDEMVMFPSLGGGRESTDMLDEEARYQKDLKDRIKRSYVDLGMKPEGILLRGDNDGRHGMVADSLEFNDSLDYGLLPTGPPQRDIHSQDEDQQKSEDEHPASDHSQPEVDGIDRQGGIDHTGRETFNLLDTTEITATAGLDDNENKEGEEGHNIREREEGSKESNTLGKIDHRELVEDSQNLSSSNHRLVENKEDKTEAGEELRDSLEEIPPGRKLEEFRDSLDITDDANNGLRKEMQIDNFETAGLNKDGHEEEEVKSQSTESVQGRWTLVDGNGGNTNTNAQTSDSPPPVSKPDSYSVWPPAGDDLDGNSQSLAFHESAGGFSADQYDNQYDGSYEYADTNNGAELDTRQDHSQYGSDAEPQRVQANQEEVIESPSKEYQRPSGNQHQGYGAAYGGHPPPAPPPMPPEPPAPTLAGEPTSAGKVLSRPTTNPFDVDGYQIDLASYRHPDMTASHTPPHAAPPATGDKPPSERYRTQPSSSPPLERYRTHLPQATQEQNSLNEQNDVETDFPSSRANVSPVAREHTLQTKVRSDGTNSKLLQHSNPPESSYLDQFKGKKNLPNGDKPVSEMPLSRKSDRSSSRQKPPSREQGALESLQFQSNSRKTSKPRRSQGHSSKASSAEKKHQVEYISEDSDDEDLHFVDEMGNPIDTQGKLLTKSPPTPEKKGTPKPEYRMKRVPSKKNKPPSSKPQSSEERTASNAANATDNPQSMKSPLPNGRGSKVSQTSQVPSAARQRTPYRAGTESRQDSQLVSEITQTDLPIEGKIIRSVAQVEGGNDATIPSSTTGGNVPIQNQFPQYMGHVGHPQYGNPQMQQVSYQQFPNHFVPGHPMPGQVVLAGQPAFVSPSTSYAAFAPQMYAQYQPVMPMGINPVQTVLQPMIQQPQMIQRPQMIQQPQMIQRPQMIPTGDQQQMHPQLVQMLGQHQQSPGPHYGLSDQQPAQNRTIDPEGSTRYRDPDGRRTGGSENSPSPAERESLSPGQIVRHQKHLKGVRGLLAERRGADGSGQSRDKKKTPKNSKSFIDANKNNVRNRQSDRKYREMYMNGKSGKSPMSSRPPLPDISHVEEDEAQDKWAYREDVPGMEEEEWTKQLIEEQRMLAVLKRNQSESDILDLRGALPGRTAPPARRIEKDSGRSPRAEQEQAYSYSADHAVLYARMQAPGGHDPKRPMIEGPAVPRVGRRDDQRERFAYTHPMPARCSPFEVLPDIQQADNETRTSDPDGYLVKLKKQKQTRPAYKEYTIRDYRALKRDIKLGGLGPDSDRVQEKLEKAQRQKDYARAIKEQNKKVLKKASKPWTPPREKPPSPESTKRAAALRYAKNIPRPPLRTNQETLHAQLYGRGSQQSSTSEREGATTYVQEEMAKLEELAERHRQEREEIEKLRNGHTP